MDPKKKTDLQEKASDSVGGGETGVSKSAEPTGVRAKAPGNSKDQGDKASGKLDGEQMDTDPENNTKATGDTSAKNKSSVSMKEDMAVMFDGEDLSEQFKEKATTFFEAAVHARLQEEVNRLEEEYSTNLEEQVTEIAEELSSKLNDYMDYVVQEWMKENEVAITSSLRSDITEEFIDGLKKLCEDHYIDLPEDKVDVVEELSAQVEELTAKLNGSIEEQIELKKQIDEQTKQLVFAEVSEGLADTQADKFKTLAEGVEYSDVDSYKHKLEIVKESYFTGKKPAQLIVESEIDGAEPTDAPPPVLAPSVANYVRAISRTVKK
jgi:hypothetical protein